MLTAALLWPQEIEMLKTGFNIYRVTPEYTLIFYHINCYACSLLICLYCVSISLGLLETLQQENLNNSAMQTSTF